MFVLKVVLKLSLISLGSELWGRRAIAALFTNTTLKYVNIALCSWKGVIGCIPSRRPYLLLMYAAAFRTVGSSLTSISTTSKVAVTPSFRSSSMAK